MYMKSKLDLKDKKILKILDRNARATVAKIERKTGIQRDSIVYRIKRMQKLGVIKYFHTVLDPVALGYPVYTFVNFILQNMSENTENSFIQFLKKHPNVTYIAKTTGKWDFTINIAAKNLKHFNEILTEIRRKFSKIIKDYEVSSIIEEIKYDYMVDLI